MLSSAAMQRLPDPITRDEYRALRAEPARWRGAAAAIAATHGVPTEPLRPWADRTWWRPSATATC